MRRGMYRDWPEDRQRSHRIYRAFQELLLHPAYEMNVARATLIPELTVIARQGFESPLTKEAERFREQYRIDLIEHHEWLEADE